MTLHLLDLIDPRIDQYRAQQQQLIGQIKALEVREQDIQLREQELEKIDKAVWEKVEKKAAKKAKKQSLSTLDKQNDNIVNLAQGKAASTQQTTINTADIAGFMDNAENNSSLIGTAVMIGAALIICITSAFFYRNKQAK